MEATFGSRFGCNWVNSCHSELVVRETLKKFRKKFPSFPASYYDLLKSLRSVIDSDQNALEKRDNNACLRCVS